jgi:hypothetical protein
VIAQLTVLADGGCSAAAKAAAADGNAPEALLRGELAAADARRAAERSAAAARLAEAAPLMATLKAEQPASVSITGKPRWGRGAGWRVVLIGGRAVFQ